MGTGSSQDYQKIKLRKIGAYFGAEVNGVDLTKKLTSKEVIEITQALAEHEFLVFKNQNISSDDQIRFAKIFGKLSVHPFSPNSEKIPELIIFENDENNPPFGTDIWHSDETFRDSPPMATCLRAIDVPKVGGDTLFSSMSAAYDGLSERMKSYISGLEAIHDFKPFKKLFGNDEAGMKDLHRFELMWPPVAHPVVRSHPVTGRKVVFVNPQFTVQIKGMNEFESRSLLTDLFDLAKIPEYQYRLHWENNTMVLWDNRSVQHYAVHDYWPQRRHLERVTIEGDKPFGSDVVASEESLLGGKSPQPAGVKPGHGNHAPKREFLREIERSK